LDSEVGVQAREQTKFGHCTQANFEAQAKRTELELRRNEADVKRLELENLKLELELEAMKKALNK
jgi:hypothetical protein